MTLLNNQKNNITIILKQIVYVTNLDTKLTNLI